MNVCSRHRLLIATCLLTLLAGCASPHGRVQVPDPLTVPPPATRPAPEALDTSGARASELRRSSTPERPVIGSPQAGLQTREELPRGMGSQPLSINVDSIPVPAFANEVFGNLLGVSFQMDDEVARLTDLVTLRTGAPQPPANLYRLARQVLGEYGVDVRVEGEVVSLRMATEGARLQPPIVMSGRALPDVPVSHRPVFYLLELEATRSNEALRWFRTIFGAELQVEEDANRNALLLQGRPDQIRQAVETIRVFDRPFMRGRASARLEPAFMSATELSTRLVEVLVAEGYGASSTFGVPAAILIMPIASVNAVIVFTQNPAILEHTVRWARELDRPNPAAGTNSMFYYPVRNTRASDIAAVLSGQGTARTRRTQEQAPPAGGDQASGQQPQQQPRATAMTSASGSFSLIVDEPRNALIFQGDPAEWERLLPLVRQMDRAARQVMVEVTIAEVSLDDNEEFGVSWFAKAGFGRFGGQLRSGTLPTTGGGGGPGLTYLLDVAGQNRAQLRAFADDQRVSILSTPRLMVMSGQEASIDVGTEVPTITAQTTSPQQTEGSSNLLQAIQYRKTGIILRIRPTVYSDDRIDLDISQEVSEALPLGDTGVDSPSIFNRSVQTSLSLRDGGSIVIGGLMSQRQSDSDSGIPFLKDVPVLGNLFKSQSRNTNKTELVLMIVPYIIGSDERASEVSRAIGDQLELLELPQGLFGEDPLAVPPSPRNWD